MSRLTTTCNNWELFELVGVNYTTIEKQFSTRHGSRRFVIGMYVCVWEVAGRVPRFFLPNYSLHTVVQFRNPNRCLLLCQPPISFRIQVYLDPSHPQVSTSASYFFLSKDSASRKYQISAKDILESRKNMKVTAHLSEILSKNALQPST